MKPSGATSLAILLCVSAGVVTAAPVDIPGKDIPPEPKHRFSGIVQQIDAKMLTISRPHETHTFLLTKNSDGHRLEVPANALHRPVEVTCTGNRDPYVALNVRVLTSLPKPTPKPENTPTRYLTGITRELQGDHLTVQSGNATHIFVLDDALTVYYDRQGYVIVNPHPTTDLPNNTRVRLTYNGAREPFNVLSIEILR